MFEIRMSRVVQQIVSHHLIGQGRKDEALYIDFDVRMADIKQSIHTSRGIHLLYHQIPNSNSITVFSAVSPSPFDRLPPLRFRSFQSPSPWIPTWKHEVSHDSCWTDVRIFSDTYFAMAEEINNERRKASLEEIAPIKMSQDCFFAGFGRHQMFQWLPVSVCMDPADENNYRRTVSV
jgi:hypothetical protein